MAKRQGMVTELMELASKLPWQVGAGMALVSGITFHVVGTTTGAPVAATSVADLGSIAVHQFIHVLATILQYVVPAALTFGAIASFVKRSRRQSLVTKARIDPMAAVSSITWQQFEALVGEAFRLKGFSVAELGGSSPDGGVDLVLSKAGERFLVQCKHWRARQVSVTVVRELYGVMAAQGAAGGYVVTAGQFTKDAREFAQGRNIELVDSDSITGLIGNSSSPNVLAHAPSCPRCSIPMVERVAKHGKYAGQTFWGCRQYPKCREILRDA
jgi:restriction system protein